MSDWFSAESDAHQLLDRIDVDPKPRDLVPVNVDLENGHLVHLLDYPRQADIGPDGHPLRGVFPVPPRPGLRRMFAGVVAVGSEVDHRSHVLTGPILLDRLTVAGE